MAARQLIDFAQNSRDPGGQILRQVRLIAGLGELKTRPASATPINGSISPHRSIEWTTMPLVDVKAVRRALSCTVNDVVLATVTGAVRKLMQRRQIDPSQLDFRVSSPVNLRPQRAEGEMGNHVSSWIVRLPLGHDDPLDQLKELRATTSDLKRSNQAAAVKVVTNMLEWLPFSTQSLSVGTINSIVTNVPGPQFPLYMLGAQVHEMIPFAPLIENVGLTIGVLSYDGAVHWGFNADSDRLPDLTDFRIDIQNSFQRLAEAAGVILGTARNFVPGADASQIESDAAQSPEAISKPEEVSEKSAKTTPKIQQPRLSRVI
jgi:WS/DGAT/MGAT family acyltransferase